MHFKSQVGGEFSDMFAALPDAEPRRADTPATAIHRQKSIVARHPAVAEQLPDPIDGRPLSQQIAEHLEQYNIAAVSQLQIEVHGGVVVVVGAVPTAYEKQLISHFCRQMPGVATFVDGMVVRDCNAISPRKRLSSARRRARERYDWRLPFRGRHAGMAVVVVLAWAVMTLGHAHPDGDRLAVHPVVGRLLVDGQPASGGMIVLHPQDPSIPSAVRPTAQILADGTFKVTTYEPGDGAPVSEYKLTVEWRRLIDKGEGELLPGPNVIPAIFGNPKSTTFRATVREGTNNLGPLEIR